MNKSINDETTETCFEEKNKSLLGCVKWVLGYLSLDSIAILSMVSIDMYQLISGGFEYPVLHLYQNCRYHIPAKLSQYLVPMESLEGRPCCRKKQHRGSLLLAQAGEANKRGSLVSSTDYCKRRGGFKSLTGAQAQRLRVEGTTAEFIGSSWFLCSKAQQHVWLSRVRGVRQLYVDVDITGDNGIEPLSLLCLLHNNVTSIESLKIYWVALPLSLRQKSYEELMNLHSRCGTANSNFGNLSATAASSTTNVIRKSEFQHAGQEMQKKGFCHHHILRKISSDKLIHPCLSNAISLPNFQILKAKMKYAKNNYPRALKSSSSEEGMESDGSSMSLTFEHSSACPEHTVVSASSIIISSSTQPISCNSSESIISANEISKTPNPAGFQCDSPIIFPKVNELSIQLASQSFSNFFFNFRAPNCKKLLLEETQPVYFRSMLPLKKQQHQQQAPMIKGDEFPKERESTHVRNHLSFWKPLLMSTVKLEQAHLLLGSLNYSDWLPVALANEIRPLFYLLLENNYRTLKTISCRFGSILSQEIVRFESQAIANPSSRKVSSISNYKDFNSSPQSTLIQQRRISLLSEVDCESSPIVVGDFALQLLLTHPYIRWHGKTVVLSNSNMGQLSEPLTSDSMSLNPQAEETATSLGLGRPTCSKAEALLERWLLRRLEKYAERLIIGGLTREFAATFSRKQQRLNASSQSLRQECSGCSEVDERPDSNDWSPVFNARNSSLNFQNDIETTMAEMEASSSWYPPKGKHFRGKVSKIPHIPSSYTSVSLESIKSLLGERMELPRVTKLEVLPIGVRSHKAKINFFTLALRVEYVIKHSIIGTGGKHQNPLTRIKNRLRLVMGEDCPISIMAHLPKFNLELNSLRFFEQMLRHPEALHQLRGLSGSLNMIIAALHLIQRRVARWSRPDIKAVEIWLSQALIRSVASVAHVLPSLSGFKNVAEIRIYPKSIPTFLTLEEIFSEDSPEADILREILRVNFFHRDRVAEAEVRGTDGKSMFVFTRPFGIKSKWRRLALSKQTFSRPPEVDV